MACNCEDIDCTKDALGFAETFCVISQRVMAVHEIANSRFKT